MSWADRDEPDLCSEPVRLECARCGIAMQADPIDLAYEDEGEDNAEYVCLGCTNARAAS